MHTRYDLLTTHLAPMDRLDGWITSIFIASPIAMFFFEGIWMTAANIVLAIGCLYVVQAHVRMMHGLREACVGVCLDDYRRFRKDVYSYGRLLTLMVGGCYFLIAWVVASLPSSDHAAVSSVLISRMITAFMMAGMTYLYVVHMAIDTYQQRMLNQDPRVREPLPPAYMGRERRHYRRDR